MVNVSYFSAPAIGERVGKPGTDHFRSPIEGALMRDFRDAKAMARSLRDALTARSVPTTHSESLELIAKAFGYDNWNVLSARIDAPPPPNWPERRQDPAPLLYCSFCGKCQTEVNKLVAGPAVFICDECIHLCTDIVDDQLLRLMEGDSESARGMPTESLQHYALHAERGARRNRQILQRIASVLAFRRNGSAGEEALAPDLAQLKNKTQHELRAMQTYSQAQLKSYERALRTATAIVAERVR